MRGILKGDYDMNYEKREEILYKLSFIFSFEDLKQIDLEKGVAKKIMITSTL